MKRIISIFMLIIVLLVTHVTAFATTNTDNTSIEYLEDGSYYVTVIGTPSEQNTNPTKSYASTQSTHTVTNYKTTYYKNSSGQTMWYVKVTGTFTYGNGTSKCTAVTPSAASQNTTWKVSNISGIKSGNSASATATGKQYYGGSVVLTKTKTVTLSCSSTGVFS